MDLLNIINLQQYLSAFFILIPVATVNVPIEPSKSNYSAEEQPMVFIPTEPSPTTFSYVPEETTPIKTPASSTPIKNTSSVKSFFTNLHPYMGIGIGETFTGFKTGYGDNLFNKRAPSAEIFLGVKFHENFGIEIGYASTAKKSRDVVLQGGDLYLGYLVDEHVPHYIENIKFRSTFKLNEYSINLTLYYPMNKKIIFLSKFGLSYNKAHLTTHMFELQSRATGNIVEKNMQRSLIIDNEKLLFTLSVGIQHQWNENLGFQFTANWKNTSKLNPSITNENKIYVAKLKDSFSYKIGIIITLR